MNIRLIAVGKIKEKYLISGIDEYLKRLQAYCKIEICEAKEESFTEPLSARNKEIIMSKEAKRILTLIPKRYYTVALDRKGKQLSSNQLAQMFKQKAIYGLGNIAFIIGGSLGLADEVIKQANTTLSCSRLTFPHQLMRLIWAEQVYRAMTIIKGEKYHK